MKRLEAGEIQLVPPRSFVILKRNFMLQLRNVYKKVLSWGMAHKVVSVALIVLLLIAGYFSYTSLFAAKKNTQYVIGTAKKGDLVITVNGTGQVAAENQVDLKPQGTTQSAETIKEVDVKQGDTVKAGQLIATINNKSAEVSLEQAKANVESSQASYDKLVNGATSETIQSGELSVQNAQQNLVNKIQNDYVSVSNSIATNVDPLFSNPELSNPVFRLEFRNSSTGNLTYVDVRSSKYSNDSQLQNQKLTQGRVAVTDALHAWNDLIQNGASADATSQATTANGYLTTINDFLNVLADTVNSLSSSDASQQVDWATAISNAKSEVASARSSVQSAMNDITSGTQSIASAKSSLNQTTAAARSEDIAIAKAQLDSNEASLTDAQNNYDNSFIRAPFDGVVAQVNVSAGDQANTETVIATIITQQQIAQISLNEVDAASVKLGDSAVVTFSALSGITATGTVAQIDTIGTVTQGVVSYNAKIAFNAADSGVKPGMSASAKISVGKDSDVLLVPNSAVSTVESSSTVQVLDNVPDAKDGATVSTKVTPRLIQVEVGDSDNTNTVITSGLTEGQLIVVHTVTGATAKSSGGLFSAPSSS
ncbi:MAG: efflux RND transporter periplasmic adaptor subunit [Candidatus Pacebacteria bacterium]|nr:efflux RND transporter periplasmic adaptor subunit [Candidatus Paceibacterota bacterium]